MKIRLLLMITLLVAALIAPGCAGKKAQVDPSTGQVVEPAKPSITGDDILNASKKFGKVLAISLDKGIKLEATLAANGTIDKTVEPRIREGLLQAQTAVASFNERAATWTHFDASSRADIEKLLQDTLAFISDLNDNGILHIKNPNSQMTASMILLGASAAVDGFKLLFDELQQ